VSFDTLYGFNHFFLLTFSFVINENDFDIFVIGTWFLAEVKEGVLLRFRVIPDLGSMSLNTLRQSFCFVDVWLCYFGLAINLVLVEEVEALEETVKFGLDLLWLLLGHAQLYAITFKTDTNLADFKWCVELRCYMEQYDHGLKNFLWLDTEHLAIVMDTYFIECFTPALWKSEGHLSCSLDDLFRVNTAHLELILNVTFIVLSSQILTKDALLFSFIRHLFECSVEFDECRILRYHFCLLCLHE